MNTRPLSEARDADLRFSLQAMRRAARRAWALAAQTQTAIIVSRNGVIEHIKPNAGDVATRVQEPPTPRETKP